MDVTRGSAEIRAHSNAAQHSIEGKLGERAHQGAAFRLLDADGFVVEKALH